MIVLGQKWLFSGKVVELGKSCCIQAKLVVFGQTGRIEEKNGCIRNKWLFSGKVVVLR